MVVLSCSSSVYSLKLMFETTQFAFATNTYTHTQHGYCMLVRSNIFVQTAIN